jgi:hypothetical protein
MAQICNSSYMGGEDCEIKVQGQSGQKVSRPHLNQWLIRVACTCHPQLHGEEQIGELHFRLAQE